MSNDQRRLIDVSSIYIETGFNLRTEQEEMDGIEELADSIMATGLQTDPIVKPVGDKYQIVHGHRRFRAITFANAERGAGIKRINVIIKSKITPEEEIAAMLGDINSRKLSPLGMAEAVKRLSKIVGLTNEEIAAKFGISRFYVTELHTLAAAPAAAKEAVANGDISATEVIRVVKQEDSHEEAAAVIAEAVEIAKAEGKTATKKTVEAVREKRANPASAPAAPKSSKASPKELLQSAVITLDQVAAAIEKGKAADLSSILWILRECAAVGVKAPNNSANVSASLTDTEMNKRARAAKKAAKKGPEVEPEVTASNLKSADEAAADAALDIE